MLFRVDPKVGPVHVPVTDWHKVFVWTPKLIVNRLPKGGADFYYAWLQTVERRVVVVNGVPLWEYRFCPVPVLEA